MSYTTPEAFMKLFHDFTGYSHADYPKNQRAVAQDLSETLAKDISGDEGGPLVLADSKGVYVYDSENEHRLIASGEYRSMPNSGFYEVTSLSHVGPAIAYLGVLQKYGNDAWKNHLTPMIQHLSEIREVNKVQGSDNWLNQLKCPAWAGHEEAIQKLIDYACALAGNYLQTIKENPLKFCQNHIIENFLEIESETFPIPYNTVMIATFSLAGLKSAYDIYSALSAVKIDWRNAKVLLRNLAGVNYSAGLSENSNWLYPLIKSIAGDELDEGRMFIVPYAPAFDNLGAENLSEAQYSALAYQTWGAIYSRPIVMNEAFTNVPTIEIANREPLPGDYECTSPDDIHAFIRRLKFSTGNIKEMLSNTVGFWLAGEAHAKNWSLEAIAIPGLTHGLPEGFSQYPDNLPDFNV